MKKTLLTMAVALITGTFSAQSILADFESFSLPANSAYSSTASISFSTSNAIFPHTYDVGFSYWSGGFAYTNKTDSSTAGSGNLYGVKAYKGYNASDKYVVGQNNGIIKLTGNTNSVDGFYITNTTYTYKSMKNGDMFAKKFGGVSGNDPDYFKVTVKGYLNGTMKNDSSEFYLANFTFTNNAQDYIVSTWQYVVTSNLGQVDSIKFFMYSSDMSGGFMNTPAFFAIDNFSTSQVVGIAEHKQQLNSNIYPNPFQDKLQIEISEVEEFALCISDCYGKTIYVADKISKQTSVDLSTWHEGVYFVKITADNKTVTKKLIKQ
ncbi:MAG: DUF4465 domain-containing protein [Sphingobacteriaceae bacterium]|nr:DUF4465 domain-containing protein [Sphingobacteriaceae bacterium]